MSDVHESAKILLNLYELRREAKLREARDWVNKFNPKSAKDIERIATTPDGGRLWMVLGYWEMAAALANHGAIDKKMFDDTTDEHMFIYLKLEPYLSEMRKYDPYLLEQTEKLIKSTPGSDKTLAEMKKMMETMEQMTGPESKQAAA